MNNFESLELTEKQRKIINDYLETLKSYVKKHKIDMDVYNDIEEMFFEKLSKSEKLDDLVIKKSIKEVGKAEDIFGEYVLDDTDFTPEIIFYEKLIKSGWVRDNSGAIFLGISKTLANKIGISILSVRILLLLLCIVGGLSAWLYILAGIILPVNGINYSGKGIFSYFSSQLILLIQNLVTNFSAFFIKNLKIIFIKLFEFIKIIFKNILPIIRFFIFGLISIGFSFVLFGFIFVGSFYFSDFNISNIEFFGVFPSYFIWGIVFGIISVSILCVATLLYGIRKKSLNNYILTFAGFSFLVSLFLLISTGFSLAKTYVGNDEIKQVSSIDIENYGTGVLNLEINKISGNDINNYFSHIIPIKVESSTGNLVKVEITRKIQGSEIITNQIKNNLNDIELLFNENNLSLSFKDNKMYKKGVPFTIIESDIVLYLPIGREYFIQGDNYYFENVHIKNDFGIYSDFIDYSTCSYKNIYYLNEEEKYVCNPSEDELESAKINYIRDKIIKDFDTISTIKHNDEYKNNYTGYYGISSDWSFDNIYFTDDNTIIVDFSDRSLDVNAQIKVIENEGVLEFVDFKINNVNVNNVFKEKYYTDISSIQDYINNDDLD